MSSLSLVTLQFLQKNFPHPLLNHSRCILNSFQRNFNTVNNPPSAPPPKLEHRFSHLSILNDRDRSHYRQHSSQARTVEQRAAIKPSRATRRSAQISPDAPRISIIEEFVHRAAWRDAFQLGVPRAQIERKSPNRAARN